jgi:hypothetical protein
MATTAEMPTPTPANLGATLLPVSGDQQDVILAQDEEPMLDPVLRRLGDPRPALVANSTA